MSAKRYSWGRYPRYPQTLRPVSWRDEVPVALNDTARAGTTTLPWGNGRSYGDSCLAASDRVLAMGGLRRVMSVDWDAGILRAEAGVTLADILALAIPHGWFLPVTPGTQFVTLGGAVANDVHGKNHHRRGTFGAHIRRFALQRSDSGLHVCDANADPALFSATIGGLGLTGVILWVELQLMPVTSSFLDVVSTRFGDLPEFFVLSEALDEAHEYGVAWIDCLARGRTLGRGIYMAANHADDTRLAAPSKRKLAVPLTPPVSLINGLTLRAFNALYYGRHKEKTRTYVSDHDRFFYPLDGILHWNRIYGPHGFQQYQCVIPTAAAHDGISAILAAIADSGTGSFLAVLKRCGDMPSPGLLSFPMAGTSLALDFPESKANQRLFPRLDAIVREAGGRLYAAKDAHMSGEDFRAAYPTWTDVEALRDPVLLSRFWQRVIRS
ncbi:MAG: FAD-binding oxidoreductase [Gammaproteobacteria bacterium]|nr:FAD-binding oxidoreductase [Gammaproteobacteria bacterium]